MEAVTLEKKSEKIVEENHEADQTNPSLIIFFIPSCA